MARSTVKIKINSAAVRSLLRSGEMEADLAARAARIAAAAGDGFKSGASIGPNRARASVWTASYEAMQAEAEHRRLTSAMGAGR